MGLLVASRGQFVLTGLSEYFELTEDRTASQENFPLCMINITKLNEQNTNYMELSIT
jgi:hypothetical protein